MWRSTEGQAGLLPAAADRVEGGRLSAAIARAAVTTAAAGATRTTAGQRQDVGAPATARKMFRKTNVPVIFTAKHGGRQSGANWTFPPPARSLRNGPLAMSRRVDVEEWRAGKRLSTPHLGRIA
jgi:hypothetical protein